MQIPFFNNILDVTFRKKKVTQDPEPQPEIVQEVQAELVKETMKELEEFVLGSPVSFGRSSQPVSDGLFGFLQSEVDMVKPDFSKEAIKFCYHLAKYNGDVSYAVDNVVQLSNTPEHITFDDGVSTELGKEMIKYLVENSDKIFTGGMNSLKNAILAQAVTTGAISYEKIPNRRLTDLERLVLVDPYYIEFKYNSSTYSYDAYQRPPGNSRIGADLNLKKLNPEQYRYFPIRVLSDNPYGIPPFMSAFESLDIEKDMLKNMRNIIRRLGVFGFLSVMLTAPKRKQSETEEAFYARCTEYLNRVRPEIEKGYGNGIALGFEGQTKYNLEASNVNVQGAKDIMNMLTERMHAGLKQDPLMLGRNFNVAETMARVIMTKLTTQIGNYQRMLSMVEADVYLSMLQMAGYPVKRVFVELDQPLIGDKLRDEQAFAARIKNRQTLRDTGVIGQDEYAQELGWEEAHADKDVDYTVPKAGDARQGKQATPGDPTDPQDTKDPNQAGDAGASGATDYTNVTRTVEYLRLHRGLPEFEYDHQHGHDCRCSYAAEDDTEFNVDDAAGMYLSQITTEYRKAVDKASYKVAQVLTRMGEAATPEQISNAVLFTLYSEWDRTFTKSQQKYIRKWVNDIYRTFRKDNSYMPKATASAVFDLFDLRALNYFESSDEVYLGKFITDTDTRKRITDFIKQSYLRDGTPIGNNPEAIAAFRSNFTDLMYLEDWKIRRVIDTSVNKMRNVGALSYMKQAGVASYQIRGVRGGNQCGYCAHLNGKTFAVEQAFDQAEKMVQGFPQLVGADMPFVTAVYKGSDGLERFKGLSSSQIQASGIHIPSFHPFCRCVIVAVS